ncbi:MAG: L-threonylcarbamoyladenylate synthase [Candidatus Eremiobacteraeota bacterium]|nr:L-threonylcarbamoyladenylate synthase [Candidatus Eremiobacteraeota bacterium]
MRILDSERVDEAHIISAAVDCIIAGGTLIFPTETVYGIGAAAENDDAIAAVFRAKARPLDKPLALHVSGEAQAMPFVAAWTPSAQRASRLFWPGPLAIIVRRDVHRARAASAGLATISLRCPDQGLTHAIIQRTGPLAATSANASGQAPFTGADAQAELPSASLAIFAGPTALQRESTIMDCTQEPPRVLRWGALEEARLVAAMGTLGRRE